MRRKVLVGLLWLAAITGALVTGFFVWMLLTPGYGDAVIAVFAGLSAAIALGAAVPLWRRRRRRRTAAAAARPTVGGADLELLRPGGRRWILVGLICAAFVAVAIWLQLLDGVNGGLLFVGLFFGAGLLVAAFQLVPGVSCLRIMTEGLVVRHLGRVRTYSWQGIDNFRVFEVRTRYYHQRFVGWDTCDDAPPGVQRSKLSRLLSGVDDSLPDTYGEDADELAQRLQRYRDQYAGRRPRREDGHGKRDPATTSTA